MKSPSLTALSPVDGRYRLEDDRLRELFSEHGLIRARLEVEVAWLLGLSRHPGMPEIPAVSPAAEERLRLLGYNLSVNDAESIKKIEIEQTNHDIKALEYYLCARLDEDTDLTGLAGFVHFACTSWDINHTAYACMLDRARCEVLLPILGEIESTLRTMAHRHATMAMPARTHGQSASPTTLGKEIAVTADRLRRQTDSLRTIRFRSKMNGAVGNYSAHLAAYPEIDWQAHETEVLASLGLERSPYTTQIEPYDQFAEFFHNLIRIHTVLLDFSRDVWQYISDGYFRQKTRASEVGSSTMPHKVNPIDFENAEGNLGLASADLNHYAQKLPISRLQRDLSDSTLLRNLGTTLAYGRNAYRSLLRGLDKLEADPERMARNLAAGPEVLAEAVQTVMKRYGLPDPYEQLRERTRGQPLSLEALREFIATLELPEDAKQYLLELTPETYLGAASTLARDV